MTKALGLDLSTTPGIVVLARKLTGLAVLHAERPEFPKLKGFARINAIATRVVDVIHKEAPDVVVIEGYGFANKNSLVTLVEIGTTIRWFVLQTVGSYLEIAPTALKKFVTGSGNAEKDRMMLEIYKRWGYSAPNNDIADGYALGCVGLAYEKAMSVPKYAQEILGKVAKHSLS